MFAISAGILLAAQSGCIGATLAGTDGSYNTPDTGLSEHAPVQAVTAWEGMSNLIVACQIADTFADMLFTGVLDAAYAVHAVLSLTAVDNITDTPSLVLGRASDITTFVSSGHTYAAVAAYTDYGVQILNITDPLHITAAGNITDIGEQTADLELRGASGITTFESGGHTYAAVAAHLSDSVQILNVTDPLRITPAGYITDTPSLELNGARGITTFESGVHTYAAVAASADDGVQILNVTDPSNITPAGHITDDGTNTDSLELWDARGITIFESGGHKYAAVAAYEDDGVQILNVTDPSNITAAGSITDTDTLELEGAYGITTFVSGGHTYAAVAAYLDDGVQILDITDPLHITPAGSIDTNTLKLNGAQDITTFTSGDHTYVAVAAYVDSGVQILDVTDPLHITAAGNIADIGNNTDDLELYRAQGITTFTSGGHIYAAVAAYEDDGVQIIRIDIPPDTTLPADAFVTTWKTTSADQSITINFVGDDMNISWGDDGTTETNLSGPQTHIYTKAGNYTVSVTGGLTGLTLDRSPDSFGSPGLVPELASIDQWGGISWTNMSNAFAGASNMTYMVTDTPDLSLVANMSNMFGSATSFDGDLSSWDVSSVTDMSNMFRSASSFNQPLNDWDVSSVTDMALMFFRASFFDQPLNDWNVSSVTDMSNMFRSASSFNQPLNDWDVSSVTDMALMFFRASFFDQPLNDWNVSSVTDMHNMFAVATSFDQPLNDWDVSSVTDMSNMFHFVSSFNQHLNSWNVSSVTDMNGMFHYATVFNQPLNDWDVSSVTYMSAMFYRASDFNQPLNDWDVSSVREMGTMFFYADSFNQNLGNWYVVANATSIARADVPGVVAEISAQNDRLNGHNPTYGISRDNDYAFFEIVNDNKINMTSVGTKSSYTVIVTASGSNVFEDGNNWRILNVTVTGGVTNAVPELNSIGSQSVSELQSLTFTATATDANSGDTLTFLLTGTPPTGATITDDGVFTWTPTESQDGDHTITVQVTDGSLTDSETLTVTVNEVNVAPVLNAIGDKGTSELVELTFTATASDTDVVDKLVNTLTFSFDGTVPSGAAITDDGNFTWTPTESQDGDHTITVQVTDGSLTDSETLTVTVNEVNVAPVLNAIGDKGTSELVELTFTATASDTDVVDNVVNTLTFSFDGTVPSGAAITDDGNFTWTPTESQVGSHDITVQVTDGSLTDSETLTVTVRDVNVAPVLNTIDDQTVNEFVELTFTATASDDDSLTFSFDGTFPSGAAITDDGNFTWTPTELQDGDHTITVQVTDGSLTDSETLTVTVNEVNVAPVLNAIGDKGTSELVELTFTATASDTDVVDNVVNTLTFSFDGTVPSGAAITDDGNFTWTPTESQVGSHDITVQVTDGSLTDSETLTVTVRDVNVAPVLNTIDDQTVNEFVELTFTATASDDDSLTFSFDGTFPSGAAITDDGNFTWTPTESQDGDHTITVQVTDGSLTDSETLTVTVNEVNVAPVLNAIGDKGTSELVELTFTATASDTDVVDNVVNTLTFSFDGTVPSGAAITDDGNFTWTPTESQVGSHDITVQVTDGSLTDSETLTVTVRDVNVAPVLNTIDDQTVNEFVELTFTATASDDDSLTFSFDGTFPSGAAITDDGNFTWTPTESQDGDHTITVQVTDGSLTDSETLTVTVNEVNVAPVLNAIGDKGTSELVELTFTATASDTDVVDNVVNTLTFSFDGTVPSGAAITSAGVFTWTPTESQVGSHDITVQVTDGSLTDSETLTVTVRDVNVAPVLNTIDDQTVNEFVELTFTATASDDDSLTFSFDGTFPSGAAITDDGNFTWTPTESQDGDHTITVQVTDGSLTDSETLTVTVNEVNVAPVLNTIDDQTVNELVELTFTATASDTDVVDNVVNTLTFSFDGTVPSGAAITDDGNFTWTPTESQVGSHDITVQVTDGSLTDSETLTVTVRDVNVAPVLNTIDDQTVNEFVELTFTATASDDDSLTFSFDGTFPSGAAITDDGNFTWTPTESQDGDHTITVQVTDGSLTDSETLTVTVNEVNVAPVLNTIGDKGTSELVELTFTATALDTDVVDNLVNTLTFSFDGTVPPGAAITSAGVFTWTPTESQVGSHDITVQVTDGSLTDSETLTVTVKDTTAPRRITLSADAFITTWRTDSANQTITIPVGGSTARYSIDWGDNSPAETDITGDSTHTYREADSYTVSISGGLERFHLDGQQPNAGRLASIEQWGDTRWTTMDAAFDGATNMVYRATDTPDLSGVTDMHRMFGDATAFNGDLSSWDVSKVTDMSDMFIFAYDFNGNLSSWDVSSVTNMNEMFAVATSFNQPLNDWDVSSVTYMSGMFYYASVFNHPLNDWDVSRVTNMDDMFNFATAFSQNLGNWYVVANATSIARADVPGVVAEISAQNDYLNDHNPTYGIGRDSDYAFFEIVNGNKINMTSVGTKSSYMVNVTASGSKVFEDGNNWRMLVVKVPGDNNADNADLGGLTISSGTLSPQFSSSDITYTASVDNSVTQVTVTSTASDSLATITVNGNTVTSGTGYILTGLTVDEPNTVTVIVTAQDSTTKTYIITLTRAASLSDNADLGSLTISSGTLSPQFSSSDITYTASVDNSVTQVTVTSTASDSLATITVNGNTVTSGTGYILTGLTVDEPNTVTVIVTAQDSTTKTYIITLTRAASLSDNADLGGLTISSGTLSPQFSSSDITYTASVDNSVTQVTVTSTASDSLATIAVNGNTVTSGTGYILTGLTVGTTTVTVIVTAQDSTTKTYTITVTVRDVPITVSSAAYNPGNGQLTITFNQDIATVDYSGLHVRSSANPDTGGITLSSVTGADYSGRTITATLDSEQQDQYDALQSPHLVVEDGAVTDTDGDRTTDVPPQPIRDASQKGSSSSSSKAPIVHINALAQSRLVDIPPHITEQVESHDASDPLEPITPDGTFDLPLVINGYGYLLDAYENTLIPQTVTAGDNPVHITFTVYTEKEFAHFILYLNLQGRNTNYADSDTYITYKDDGTTSVTDPHGYIGSATVTVTQEDDQIPEKRTVRITIEFGEEPMGPTNMVAYMWNTDREALFVKIIDALEVVAASPESAMQAADPEPLEPDSVLPADPEPVTPDFADDAADPEPVPYDILGPDDYDDTQILQIIRMWSGFESESITDEQLLELLGLDDHQGADIPDWMMTELGVLVAKGTVTVDEFMLALQYVLEHD